MAVRLFKRDRTSNVFEQLDEEDANPAAAEPSEGAATEPETVDEATESDAGPAAETDETDEPEAADVPRRRRPGKRAVALAAAGAVLVAALAGTAVLGWQYKQHSDVANARQAALATAKDYAVTLTSIDTNGIDENFNQVINGATGEFKDMYSQSAEQLRQVLIENEAKSQGTVVDAAVKSASEDKVEVLLFIDQSITNLANPEPRLDRSRVDITMERVDGRWLASSVALK